MHRGVTKNDYEMSEKEYVGYLTSGCNTSPNLGPQGVKPYFASLSQSKTPMHRNYTLLKLAVFDSAAGLFS